MSYSGKAQISRVWQQHGIALWGAERFGKDLLVFDMQKEDNSTNVLSIYYNKKLSKLKLRFHHTEK